MAELTPMKAQYNQIKAQYEDCLLFFRLGDFYEMFDDDAKLASRELDLALTTRDRGKPQEEQTPMCGVPYHSAEAYIGRLIAKGYKIAICEQTEDPATARGLVSRDVIRIISPGTVTESSMLEEGKANYIASVWLDGGSGAVSFADISTGEFTATGFAEDAVSHICNELGRFSPREVLLCPSAEKNESIMSFVSKRLNSMPEKGGEKFELGGAYTTVCGQFNVSRPEELGFQGDEGAVRAAGALLSFIKETQKFDISHINSVEVCTDSRYMELDYTTMRNLELTESLRFGEKRGTLLWVLDKTRTSMGARMLRRWIELPLVNQHNIGRRQRAVAELSENFIIREEISEQLRKVLS